jgi:hypothetical protein
MSAFYDHLDEREGRRTSFYRDHNGLVTIGVGQLVDVGDGASIRKRRMAARNFANAQADHFRDAQGEAVDVDAILADWERVRSGRHGRLRLDEDAIDQLRDEKLSGFVDTLYERKPFVKKLDAGIQLALLDVRYNPAGVRMFSNDKVKQTREKVEKMWNALNPSKKSFDLDAAADLFEDIWESRGRSRYQERHRMRVKMFGEGVKRSKQGCR